MKGKERSPDEERNRAHSVQSSWMITQIRNEPAALLLPQKSGC
jgi:hypothetical protein